MQAEAPQLVKKSKYKRTCPTQAPGRKVTDEMDQDSDRIAHMPQGNKRTTTDQNRRQIQGTVRLSTILLRQETKDERGNRRKEKLDIIWQPIDIHVMKNKA